MQTPRRRGYVVIVLALVGLMLTGCESTYLTAGEVQVARVTVAQSGSESKFSVTMTNLSSKDAKLTFIVESVYVKDGEASKPTQRVRVSKTVGPNESIQASRVAPLKNECLRVRYSFKVGRGEAQGDSHIFESACFKSVP